MKLCVTVQKNETFPFHTDEAGFGRLFRELYSSLRAYAGLLVDDAGEDIVQELFLYCWENRTTISIHSSVKAYLFRAVYTRCLNLIRRRKMITRHERQVGYEQKLREAAHFDPDHNPLIREWYIDGLREGLDAAIESLPEKCREVFKLSYLDARRNKEISEQLNISVNTVEKHINHALKTLRMTLRNLKSMFWSYW